MWNVFLPEVYIKHGKHYQNFHKERGRRKNKNLNV